MSKLPRGILGLSQAERDVGYVNYCITFIFSIIANFTLSYAVATKSNSLLKSYRKVFVFHIFIDVSLSLMLFLTMCQPVGSKIDGKAVYFHIIDGIIQDPSQPWTTIFASILVFLNNFNIVTGCVSFIYRYSIICCNFEFTIIPFLGLIAISGLLPACAGYLTLVNELDSKHLEEKATILFNNTDWVDDKGNLPAFGIMYSPNLSLVSLMTPITVILAYSIVIYCAVKITTKVQEFRSNQYFKLRYKNQKQLHILLFFQGIIPFFTSGLSPCAIHIGRIMGLPQPWWYFYLNLLNAWSPVINPIAALIVIAPYRNFIIQFFCPKPKISSNHIALTTFVASGKRKSRFHIFLTDSRF